MPARHHAGIIPAYAGNTTLLPLVGTTMTGSSPHTRGTLLQTISCARLSRDHPRIRGEHRAGLEAVLVLRGIIPAYAGNTSSTFAPEVGLKGSSPHTRGTPPSAPPTSTPSRDHPRIRGEHAYLKTLTKLTSGIIPAYAGNTSHGSAHGFDSTGIIPAYAGNTTVRYYR